MVGVWRKDRFRKEQVQRGGWSSIQVYVKEESDGVPRDTKEVWRRKLSTIFDHLLGT